MEVISYDKQSLENNVNILENLLIIHKCTVTSTHIRWLKDVNDVIDDDIKKNNKYDELQINKENEDDEIIPSPNEQQLPYRSQKFFSSYKTSDVTNTRKRKRRSNLLKPGSQLYQFLLQLLDDESNDNIIKWKTKDNGIFHVVNKERLAQLWSRQKRHVMTYDSLSRGLRHYYRMDLLKSFPKKMHYQFTKSALDEWKRIRKLSKIET